MRKEDEARSQQVDTSRPDVEVEKVVKWGFAVDTRNKRPDETNEEFAARMKDERESSEGQADVNKDLIGKPKTVGGGDDVAVEDTEDEELIGDEEPTV